jgi:oxalate decarboxylase
MSKLQRREFLAAAGVTAAGAAALARPGVAEAGDPSFMNNVPDPLLAGADLPTFKFELEKSAGKVDNGSEAREATVKQLPISKGIAGVSMTLAPGTMRELHWHATAAEWAFVNKGESGRQSSPRGDTQRRMTSRQGTYGISRAATATCWSASATNRATSS